MKKLVLLLMLAMCSAAPLHAQFRSLLKKANKQYELHAFNLAIKSYRDAIQRRPDNAEALAKLADCYRHLNQMEDAERWYAQAVKQRKVDPQYIFNYARVLKALGKYDQARQWFLLYAQSDAVAGNHFAQSCNFSKSQLAAPSNFLTSREPINTSASEFGAAFYGDNVVFSSARTDIKRSSSTGQNDKSWTGRSFNQLFLAKVNTQSGQLSSPVFLKRVADGTFNQGPLAFAPDGRTVVFTKNDFVDGTRHIATSGMQLGIYIAEINRNGDWTNEIPFPYNGTDYSTGFPNFSPDGQVLYFSSNRPDGFGGYDIYVSYRTGNGWSTPENLGPVINSPGNEVTPFFDGQSLYFSSDWHQGMGGYDVFRGEQNNGRWIRTVHLGARVNSPRDDYGFIFDSFKNQGYLTSNRAGGRGNEDIYKVTKSGDGIVIRVRNASDGQPINGALIDFTGCNMGQQSTDANGMYSFQATGGVDCDVTISKEEYVSSNLDLTVFGISRNRTFDVTLSKRGEEYVGNIVSYATRNPVRGVTIIASNQKTGSYSETKSNSTGEYALALSPGSTYILRYSGPGFRDVNRTVRTMDGFDRGILGVISMLPSNAAGGDPNAGMGDGSGLGGGTVDLQSGYAVQVAAISQPEMERFSNLENLGQLYYRSEGRLYKVRVGVFGSRQEAEQALSQVKRNGFSGAFIVEERGGEANAGGAQSGTEPGDTGGGVVDTGRYKIQLGAFRNAGSFDPGPVSHLGYIEDRQRNNLTIKLLTGFGSESEAKLALQEVHQSGFPSAFVVLDENGKLNRVR